jgi:hypothetical protein
VCVERVADGWEVEECGELGVGEGVAVGEVGCGELEEVSEEVLGVDGEAGARVSDGVVGEEPGGEGAIGHRPTASGGRGRAIGVRPTASGGCDGVVGGDHGCRVEVRRWGSRWWWGKSRRLRANVVGSDEKVAKWQCEGQVGSWMVMGS